MPTPGLEFKAVVVMACDDDVLPLQSRIESVADEVELDDIYDTERQLLYVACTRARDRLMVSSVQPGSEFWLIWLSCCQTIDCQEIERSHGLGAVLRCARAGPWERAYAISKVCLEVSGHGLCGPGLCFNPGR
jgi:hypothetical protein